MWVYKCLALVSILFAIYQDMNRTKAAARRIVRFLLWIFYTGAVGKHPGRMLRRLLGIQASGSRKRSDLRWGVGCHQIL